MLIDTHTHSTHTAGAKVRIADLVATMSKRGLDGFCLTDVHTVAGGEEAKRLAAEAGLVALVGFEAVTDRGHFLVFVPDPLSLPAVEAWIPPGDNGLLPFDQLSRLVREKNGVLVAAHPYDRDVEQSPGDGLVQMKGVAALEVDNACRSETINGLAQEVAAGLGIPGLAGSDCRDNLDRVGSVACLLPGPIVDEAGFIDRIRSADIWPVKIGRSPVKHMPRSRGPRNGQGASDSGRRSRDDRGGRRSAERGGGRSGDRGGSRSGDRSRRPRGKRPDGPRKRDDKS